MKNYIKHSPGFLLIFSGVLLLVALVIDIAIDIYGCKYEKITLPLLFPILFIAAIMQGIYYGKYNNWIFHYPHAEDNDSGEKPLEFLSKTIIEKTNKNRRETTTKADINLFTVAPFINKKAQANTLWVHILCSTVGAIALYMLFSSVDLSNPSWSIKRLQSSDLILILVALLGYTGLLPMTLWFFANSGKILEGLIKR